MGTIKSRALIHYILTMDQSCSPEPLKTHTDIFKNALNTCFSRKKLQLVTSTVLGHPRGSGTGSLLVSESPEQCGLQSPAWLR